MMDREAELPFLFRAEPTMLGFQALIKYPQLDTVAVFFDSISHVAFSNR